MKEFINKETRLGCALAPVYLPIGIAISYLILAAVMLDFGDAFAVMAISIICTAGISLIIWVPGWYLLGLLAISLLRIVLHGFGLELGGLFDAKKESPADESNRPKLTRDQLALLNYIHKARDKGLSDSQIQQNLLKNGWSSDIIAAAFQMA